MNLLHVLLKQERIFLMLHRLTSHADYLRDDFAIWMAATESRTTWLSVQPSAVARAFNLARSSSVNLTLTG
jgi:hypothetical protein